MNVTRIFKQNLLAKMCKEWQDILSRKMSLCNCLQTFLIYGNNTLVIKNSIHNTIQFQGGYVYAKNTTCFTRRYAEEKCLFAIKALKRR